MIGAMSRENVTGAGAWAPARCAFQIAATHNRDIVRLPRATAPLCRLQAYQQYADEGDTAESASTWHRLHVQ
jgi:hypothetical protein